VKCPFKDGLFIIAVPVDNSWLLVDNLVDNLGFLDNESSFDTVMVHSDFDKCADVRFEFRKEKFLFKLDVQLRIALEV